MHVFREYAATPYLVGSDGRAVPCQSEAPRSVIVNCRHFDDDVLPWPLIGLIRRAPYT